MALRGQGQGQGAVVALLVREAMAVTVVQVTPSTRALVVVQVQGYLLRAIPERRPHQLLAVLELTE